MYTWGNNINGQIGNGNLIVENQYTPSKISNTKWKNIPESNEIAFNLFLGNEMQNLVVTANNEKLAFLKDIPITIDENGDYVLG